MIEKLKIDDEIIDFNNLAKLNSQNSFKQNQVVSKSVPFIVLQNQGLTLGEKPSSHQIAGISLTDKSGYGVDSRVGLIETRVEANENYTRTRLGAYRNSVENHDYYEVAVIVPEEGDGYALAPTPKADATGNEIATVKWIRENIGIGATNYVTTDTNQTVNGTKTFTNYITVSDNDQVLTETDYKPVLKTTIKNDFSERIVDIITAFGVKNGENKHDNGGISLGSNYGTTIIGSGENTHHFSTVRTIDPESLYLTSDTNIHFYVGVANDGTGGINSFTISKDGTSTFNYEVNGITPATNDNSTKFATTEYVNNKISSSDGSGRSVSWDSQINVGNLSANQVYTAPANGYILGYSANDGNASVLIKINEKEAGYAGNISSFIVPVAKGDKFVCTSEIGVKKVKFIPYK